jgi:hypothetical protein
VASDIKAAVAAKKFDVEPLGPLGAYVKLHDPNTRWKAAIDLHLGQALQSYLCHSQKVQCYRVCAGAANRPLSADCVWRVACCMLSVGSS